MIDPRFVLLASALSVSGLFFYVRDTWRGRTAPNRVTWILWGVEPLLVFGAERQAHLGWPSLLTLVLGLGPVAVVGASFHDRNSVWHLGLFDIVCAVVSVGGLVVWALTKQPTTALVIFVSADAVAALPTIRKSFTDPQSESSWNFVAVALGAVITLFTLRQFTTAGALFPLSILAMNIVISYLVISQRGLRRQMSQPHTTVISS